MILAESCYGIIADLILSEYESNVLRTLIMASKRSLDLFLKKRLIPKLMRVPVMIKVHLTSKLLRKPQKIRLSAVTALFIRLFRRFEIINIKLSAHYFATVKKVLNILATYSLGGPER